MDGAKIKSALAARAEEVCRILLPGGKRVGIHWCTGDVNDKPATGGGSLKVELEGPLAGRYHDFASDEGGSNLVDLWMAVKRVNYPDALKECAAFLGITEEGGFHRNSSKGRHSYREEPKQKKRISADVDKLIRPIVKGGAVHKWLTEKRGLTDEVISLYKVGQDRTGGKVAFPFYNPGGELECVKLRSITDKGDQMVLPSGARQMLFGMQAVSEVEQEVFITEGELDAMTMAVYGQPAVSVPFGAKWPSAAGKDPNDKWIEVCYDWLERFMVVFLALDMDEPGITATEALVPRMGRHRCRRLSMPEGYNDPNECLMQGVEDEDMIAAIADAPDMDPEKLKRPTDFEEEVWLRFHPEEDDRPVRGYETPWNLPFKISPGEVTVWQGYTGHGKTTVMQFWLDYMAVRYGSKSAIASMEFGIAQTLQNMERQLIGKRRPEARAEHRQVMEWMDDFFFLYDHVGQADADEVLEVFEYARRKYGVEHFVIDSLTKLEVDEEDNNRVKELLNKLCAWAKANDAYLHIVCHSRKPDARHPEEKFAPSRYQVRGTAHIVDLAHNLIAVWRNVNREQELDKIEKLDALQDAEEIEKILDKNLTMHSATFLVQKYRAEGTYSSKFLWFDPVSWQFSDEYEGDRIKMVEYNPNESRVDVMEIADAPAEEPKMPAIASKAVAFDPSLDIDDDGI